MRVAFSRGILGQGNISIVLLHSSISTASASVKHAKKNEFDTDIRATEGNNRSLLEILISRNGKRYHFVPPKSKTRLATNRGGGGARKRPSSLAPGGECPSAAAWDRKSIPMFDLLMAKVYK